MVDWIQSTLYETAEIIRLKRIIAECKSFKRIQLCKGNCDAYEICLKGMVHTVGNTE